MRHFISNVESESFIDWFVGFQGWFHGMDLLFQILVTVGLIALTVGVFALVYYIIKGVFKLIFYIMKGIFKLISSIFKGIFKVIESIWKAIFGDFSKRHPANTQYYKRPPRTQPAAKEEVVVAVHTHKPKPIAVSEPKPSTLHCPICGNKFTRDMGAVLADVGCVYCEYCGNDLKKVAVQ